MSKIFISFVPQDKEFVQELHEGLTQAGHEVWRYDEFIDAGQSIHEKVDSALRDADAIVLVLSEVSSNNNWIHKEYGAAFAYYKSRGKPLIIPILLDSARVPSSLSSIIHLKADRRDANKVVPKILASLEHQKGKLQAQEDERRENKQYVEATAAKFIQPTIEQLEQQEKSYRRLAYLWYFLAYFTLLLSVGFGVWRVSHVQAEYANWFTLAELFVSVALVIALLVALAKYAFTLGKSFMVESVRTGDRRHAISFGEFYLKAYGDKIERDEVREVFQHWNIDSGSFFKGQESKDFDPKLFELAIEIAKSISGEKEQKS